MVFLLWLERLQVKHINRALKHSALPTRNATIDTAVVSLESHTKRL